MDENAGSGVSASSGLASGIGISMEPVNMANPCAEIKRLG
jgi:hypothetical protein